MAQIDWYDVAPAIAFAVIAGLGELLIRGTPARSLLLGVGYIVFAGFVSAAGVAFVGADGEIGFFASIAVSAVLIAPLWRYAIAADRTPVSEAEIDEALDEAEVVTAQLDAGERDYDVEDGAEFVVGHLNHILWRLADDAPRRAEVIAAKERVEKALASAPPAD